MSKTTRETLYPETRLSAHLTQRGAMPGDEAEQPNHPLIEALRAVREQGYEAMTAAERYEPDFSIDLSRCRDAAEADALLERWRAHRTAILDDTRATLRRVWMERRGAEGRGLEDRRGAAR